MSIHMYKYYVVYSQSDDIERQGDAA